jgi:purine-binding chemotaxis protein CheW
MDGTDVENRFYLLTGDLRMSTETSVMATITPSAKEPVPREGKYLTFSLDQQEYGIAILKVREIIGMMPITSVPQTPDYVKGVINLRGKVIPILDCRRKFGIALAEQTDQTCIIVVDVAGAVETLLTGIIVDSVCEVMDIKSNDIEDAPNFGSDTDTDFILGMAKINNGVKTLLNIDRVLSISDLQSVVAAA